MAEKPENELSIDQIYDKYLDLYIHLDKLRWNVILAILVLFYSVFGVLNDLFHGSEYFKLSIGIGFLIMSAIVYQLSHFLSKFVSGQDHISKLLSNIESGVFGNTDQTPKDEISFFERRKRSIKKSKDKNPKLNEKYEDKIPRSSIIMNSLLSKGSGILFVIGWVYVGSYLFNISFSKIEIILISSLGLLVIYILSII